MPLMGCQKMQVGSCFLRPGIAVRSAKFPEALPEFTKRTSDRLTTVLRGIYSQNGLGNGLENSEWSLGVDVDSA